MNTTTAQNELIEALDYVIDKFNIQLDISTQQTMEFARQLANKIVMWEVFNKLLSIVVSIVIIMIAVKLTKKKARLFNKEVFTNLEILLNTSESQWYSGDFPKDTWGKDEESKEESKEELKDSEQLTDKERKKNYREFTRTVYRAIMCAFYTCVVYIIAFGCGINIILNTISLILCWIFPEKIILEFIGNYIR